MLLFLSMLAAAPIAPAAAMPVINPKGAQAAECPATSRYEASRPGKTPRARKLTDLPAADAYRAVYRRIGRCEAPMIVKFRVGDR